MANEKTVTLKNKSTGELKTLPEFKFHELNRKGFAKGYEIVQDTKKVAKEIEEKLNEAK